MNVMMAMPDYAKVPLHGSNKMFLAKGDFKTIFGPGGFPTIWSQDNMDFEMKLGGGQTTERGSRETTTFYLIGHFTMHADGASWGWTGSPFKLTSLQLVQGSGSDRLLICEWERGPVTDAPTTQGDNADEGTNNGNAPKAEGDTHNGGSDDDDTGGGPTRAVDPKTGGTYNKPTKDVGTWDGGSEDGDAKDGGAEEASTADAPKTSAAKKDPVKTALSKEIPQGSWYKHASEPDPRAFHYDKNVFEEARPADLVSHSGDVDQLDPQSHP